jgi:RHS repeat-associated protein
MKRTIFTIITAACLALTAMAQNDPVAAIPGKLDVTSLGTATYHIPITVPSGVNGLQPNISLNYNSNAENGLAGWGFGLNAYSMISRTGRDIVHDGTSKPITWDENDNFVLDGQRLIMVKEAGTYLDPGSEYRTEIESYKQISMIYSGLANGSKGFRVQAKDGTIYEYGTSKDSQFYLVDHSYPMTMGMMHWLLHKVTDPNGNYMTYFYGNDATNNEYWIDRIEYGGNTNSGTTAMNKIQFTYDSNRPDSRGFQIGGCIAKQTKLLTSITTYTNSVKQNEYSLDYGTYDGTVKRLTSISESNGSNEKLKPTVFNWKDLNYWNTNGVVFTGIPKEDPNSALYNTYIDLDNDGLSEVFQSGPLSWTVYKTSDGKNYTATSNTESKPFETDNYSKYLSQYHVCDVNNDNRLDIVVTYTTRANLNINAPSTSNKYRAQIDHYEPIVDVLLNVNGVLVDQNLRWTIKADTDFDSDIIKNTDQYGLDPLYTLFKTRSADLFITKDDAGNPVLGEIITTIHDQAHVTHGYSYSLLGMIRTDFWDRWFSRKWDCKVRYHNFNLNIKNSELPYQSVINLSSGGSESNAVRLSKDDIDTPTDFSHANNLRSPRTLYHADFYGSGREQVLSFGNGGGGEAFINGQPVTFREAGNQSNLWFGRVNAMGDFNGDGKIDILSVNTNELVKIENGWTFKASVFHWDGNGFITNKSISLTGNPLPKNALIGEVAAVGDFDGDGKTELYSKDGDNWLYSFHSTIEPNTGKNLVSEINLNVNRRILKYYVKGAISLHNKQTSTIVAFDGQYNNIYFDLGITNANHKISSIQNGLGSTLSINYGTLSDKKIYLSGDPIANNSANVTKVLYPDFKVVASTSLTNGSNQLSTNYYKYEGLKVNTTGYGLIGFDNTCISSISGTLPTSTNDIQTAIDTAFKTTTTYGYDPNYYITYITGKADTKKGSPISTMTITNQVRTSNVGGFTLNANKILQPYVSVQTATDHLSGITTTTEYLGVDDQNNPSKIKTTKGGMVKIDSMTYICKGSWCKNKLSDMTSTVTYGTNAPYIRTSNYTYDATNGNLLTTVTDPTDADLKVTNTYTYDKFGNQLTVKSSTKGGYRESSNTYYPSGRFIQTKKDIVGNTTTYIWDETKGTLTSQTDHTGTTSYIYDNWKTLTSTTLPTGITQSALTSWANDVAGALYKTETSVSKGAPPVTQWYDARGNVIQTKTYYLKSGSPVYQFTEYNKNGSVQRTSSPTYTLNTKTWDKTYGYDSYGRAIAVNTSEGIDSISYAVNSTTFTKSSGQRKTVNTNSAGWTSSVVDNGKTITYDYYSSGLVKNIYTDASTHYDMEYNLQGNRTKITDPDAGIITCQYNGFGNLTQQINNQSVTTKYFYGGPGGALSLRDRNGEETKYRYDNFGRLIEKVVCAFDRKTYTYDSFDRVTKLVEVIGVKPYTTQYRYDAAGNETIHTYHSGYRTTNTYDDYGQLIDVTDSYQKSIWTSPEYDAKGNLTSVVRGGVTSTSTFDDLGRLTSSLAAKGTNAPIINMGYTYNDGNLSSRTDLVNSLYEGFHYDGLDRLKSWSIYNYIPKTGDGPQVPSKGVSITYDDEIATPKGNIVQKSDIGNYQMKYNATRIHALDSIIGKPDSIVSSNWDVKYNTFNKPTKITQAEIRDAQLKILSPTKTYNITYGVDDQRIKTQSCITYAPQQTTTYTDDYEEVFNNITGGYQLIHYLRGAIFTQWYDKSGTKVGTDSLMYTYHDHQGSLIALVTDSPSGDGGIERYAYDPWGRRRNPADWTEYDKRTKWITHRGYTGHEHIDFMSGLINMNGRVYDPVTAQFLSVDNNIQAPDSWVNYNRYAYCMNNPLKYTDPSGNFWQYVVSLIVMTGFNYLDAVSHNNWDFKNTSITNVQIGYNSNYGGYGGVSFNNGNSYANTGYGANGSTLGFTYFGTTNMQYEQTNTIPNSVANGEANAREKYFFARGLKATGGMPDGQGSGEGLGASTIYGAVGTGGDVASMSNSTFRLMSGANGSISPRIYSSGWNGGSPARITTYSVSKIGTGISTGAGAISTYMAYNDIVKGRQQPITYVDAGVGTAGLVGTYASYFHGIEIPVVGEFVAAYGALRLGWDVGFWAGYNYGPSTWYGTDDTKWFK